MTDRIVHLLDSESNRKLRFSDCLQLPNIVLLGDPGAGKSHLFRTFAPSGSLFRARDFLNRPLDDLQAHSTIFIDALDEKRSGRTDVAPVDLIANRLMQLRPSQVRIACRAADWLGTSDLGAFRPYFDLAGGFVVLALEALTERECTEVLASQGCPDSSAFIAEAHARGVKDLLGNPQNLTMLLSVVQAHDWPHTRSQLYQKAVELLLTEHNPEHHHKDAGIYSANELLLPAGAACAARLIADVSGISLGSGSVEGCPTYRDLTFVPTPQLLASLTRRVFATTGQPDTVDYGHRTIAEYLAAYFLAHQVRNGLPFGRVRALISVDYRPASELRGLHAWLAVLLPEHARELIGADPFGVLSYGDASALGISERAVLLEAMSELANQDPWFRHGNWSAAPMRGLAGPDMVHRFRDVLQRSDNFSLVSVVLDAASVGTPMPDLQSDFLAILEKKTRGESLRLMALEALLHLGSIAHPSCVSAYTSIAAEPGEFSLRTRALRRLLRLGLAGPKEISELLNDALANSPSRTSIGAFYQFADQIPDDLLRSVLDHVHLQRLPKQGSDNQQAREVLRVLDRLLARYLVLKPQELDYVAKWMCDRAQVTRYRGYGVDEFLQKELKSDPERVQRLIDATLPHMQEKEAWPIVVRLGHIYPGAADPAAILAWAMRKLSEAPTAPNPLQFAIAMDCVFLPEPPRRSEFDQLLTLASNNLALQPICDSACRSLIPDWRIEESERRVSEAARRARDQSKTQQNFDKQVDAIRNGTHLGWLDHIAQVYFCQYSDCNTQASPRGRLIDLLGTDRAEMALAGLRAFVATGRAPAVPEILATHANQKIFGWWYAIVAGLDEYAAANGDLGLIPPDYLAAALTIDVLYPTFQHAGNTTSVIRHSWSTWFVNHKPQRYVDTLLAVVSFRLQRNSQYLDGFSELLELPSAIQQSAVHDLLIAFPQAPANYLAELLKAWIKQHPDVPDPLLIRRGLKIAKGTASHSLWLAAALITDFDGFRTHANALRKREAKRALVWASRELSAAPRTVPTPCTEYLFRLACGCFNRTEMPSTWMGDRNEWDATEYILSLLKTLAADDSKAAHRAMRRALEDKRTRSFRDDIKHAIAQQQIRRIDSEFRQPTWAATLATLANGAPANMADMQALVLAELNDLNIHLQGSNIDLHKSFWNEGPHGRVNTPKPENSCRNFLVRELRQRLIRHDVRVEPEGQMARQRRTDIAVTRADMKLVLELKRHYHPEVWSAASGQLDRFYARDPESKGFGIYLVLWFGAYKPTPALGKREQKPQSAKEMEVALRERLPADDKKRIACVVLDVSEGNTSRRITTASRSSKRKSRKRNVPGKGHK